MSERDPAVLKQPSDTAHPQLVHIFNTADLYSAAGFPLFARGPEDYEAVGGVRFAPYERGDSPSRDKANLPYNATWFEHLREHYGDALKLLEGIRQGYANELTDDGIIDGEGIIDVYRMGIYLPMFLLWRQDSPFQNGEIPPAMATLRQALLGVGTVILHLPESELPQLTGRDVADLAEKNGDLIGEETTVSTMPLAVCPASPEMIAGLAQALLTGNEKRGSSPLLEEYAVEMDKLLTFTRILKLHVELEEDMSRKIMELAAEPPNQQTGFSLQKPKNKGEKFDDIVRDYCRFLDEHHPALYAALGRTDQPPPMNLRRLYKTRKEYLQAKIRTILSDDLNNYDRATIDEVQSLLPQTSS